MQYERLLGKVLYSFNLAAKVKWLTIIVHRPVLHFLIWLFLNPINKESPTKSASPGRLVRCGGRQKFVIRTLNFFYTFFWTLFLNLMILLFAYPKEAFADFHFMKQRKMQIPKSGPLLSLAILPNVLAMGSSGIMSKDLSVRQIVDLNQHCPWNGNPAIAYEPLLCAVF